MNAPQTAEIWDSCPVYKRQGTLCCRYFVLCLPNCSYPLQIMMLRIWNLQFMLWLEISQHLARTAPICYKSWWTTTATTPLHHCWLASQCQQYPIVTAQPLEAQTWGWKPIHLNNRIVMSKGTRRCILGCIHQGHMAIEKCKAHARVGVYWLNM